MRGKVTRYNEFRGYGFVEGDDDQTYFVHWSFIEGSGYKYLNIDDRVEFTPVEVPKGYEAQNLKVVDSGHISTLKLKPNPFTPQQPATDPNKFAGRDTAIHNAIDCLFNHKNLLITGERGIGKSSLAFQLSYLAGGEKSLIERLKIDTDGYEFEYLCPSHRCIPGHNLINIIESLVISAAKELGIELSYDKIITELGVNLKFIKASHKIEEENKPSTELITFFVDSIERIYSKAGNRFNGILFLIDEIDCLEQKDNLAAFLKAAIETLHFRNYTNISFLLAGVTGTLTDMLLQHKSFSRLFENLELRKMSESELAEIISRCLESTSVSMEPTVKDETIKLSDRFPEPIHLLGYHSFRLDTDQNIDRKDFERAQNFIIRELKRQEFDNSYAIVRDGPSNELLRNIAYLKENSFTVEQLSKETGKPESQVSGIIGDLVRKEILLRSKPKYFRLKDPLFKVYLKWVIGK
jgi:cold shock CspA family protein